MIETDIADSDQSSPWRTSGDNLPPDKRPSSSSSSSADNLSPNKSHLQSSSSVERNRALSSISSAAASLPAHEAAELAHLDFALNGHRCRSNSQTFLLPRMVPDMEVTACTRCNEEFTFFFRRHHCRSCGQIFCHACSDQRLLLEKEYEAKDPQRVCSWCYERLAPLQARLAGTVANRNRSNEIDTQSYTRYMNMPYSKTLGSELRKAAYSVSNLFHPSVIRDTAITLPLLQQAQGLAFLTVIKGGFMFAPRIGTGLVISKLPDGRWSAPTAIATAGLSWGALIGVDVTDYVIVLKNIEAVTAFATGSTSVTPTDSQPATTPAPTSAAASWNPLNTLAFAGVRLCGEIDVALGGVGRVGYSDLHVGEHGAATAFSYCHSRGLYAGISFGGSLMFARPEVNANFYGQACTPMQCLGGEVPPPFAANCLYEALYDSVDYFVQRRLFSSDDEDVKGEREKDKEADVGSRPEPAVLGRGDSAVKKKKKKKTAGNKSSENRAG
mmetsp:Transcript_37848/g.70536  ORF Transcript_37848/g.70536 Transcript_37848/m.70536 type:complete len:498 (-) Transcript_37848:146-1639(-)